MAAVNACFQPDDGAVATHGGSQLQQPVSGASTAQSAQQGEESSSGFKRIMGMDGSLFGPASRKQVLQMALAEVLGTGMLLFLGCMGTVVGMVYGGNPHLLVAFAFGLTVMICIQTFAHVSKAHLNPAITLALVVIGDLNVPLAGVYMVSQVIGASLGYGVLLAVTPDSVLKVTSPNGTCCAMCVTSVHPRMTPLQGLLAEFLVTSILVLVLCSVFDRRNAHNTDSVSIKFGLTVAAVAMNEGSYTGGSMNPARSFGPAVWTGVWTNHWVYWVGPLAAGLLTSAFYRFVFGVRPVPTPAPQEIDQGLPLTGVRDGRDESNTK